MTHMFLIKIWLSMLALAIGGGAPASDAAPEPTRRVEVHVTVRTNGAPFPAGTRVVMMNMPDVEMFTDRNGEAVLVAEVRESTKEVIIGIPARVPQTPDHQTAERDDVPAARAFSLPPDTFITLVPEQEVYRLELFAPEAVTVTGRVLDPAGEPLRVHAHRGGTFNLRSNAKNEFGFFEMLGVPKAQNSLLFLSTRQMECTVVWMTADQTAADLDLGNIVIPTVTTDAAINIDASGDDAVGTDWGPMLTLIRDDGLSVMTLDVAAMRRSTSPGKIRAGRYYIVPGIYMVSDSSLKALRLIHSGQRLLLDTGGVPVIEAVSGQTTLGAIDIGLVQRIIDGLPE